MIEMDLIVSEISSVFAHMDESQFETACTAILSSKKVTLVGGGRSGLIAKCFAMRLSQLGIEAQVVGDCTATALSKDDLLIIVSASGETNALKHMAQKAVSLNARLLLISGSVESSLTQIPHSMILIPGVDNKNTSNRLSSQPLGTLFEQCALVLCDGLILRLMKILGENSKSMRKRHANLE